MTQTPEHAAPAGDHHIFTPGEVEVFKAEDRGAAAAIVGIMVSIFTLGLIGYLAVSLWVGL
jgi:hypothetical protein